MKKTVRIISLFISFLMIATLFSACTGGNTDNTEAPVSTESETLAPQREAPVIIEDGKAVYSIIRSSFDSDEIAAAATSLFKRIKNKTGVSISYTEDLASMNNTVNDNYEILIGNTNRPESAAKKAELSAMDWFVGVVGRKILVIGGCDESTIKAIEAFEDMIITALAGFSSGGNRLVIDTLKTDRLYINKYPVSDFSLCGHKISEYVIRYGAEESARSAASKLVDALTKNVGIVPESASCMSSNEKPYEIVIGKTSRGKSSEITESLNGVMPYSIVHENGKIYICGKGLGLEAAVNLFISDYISKDEPVAETLSVQGDAAGSTIYGLTNGADIRVMTNNVWKCDNNQPAWKEMGMDCSAKTRSVGFSYVYIAFKPDIICFQEMSQMMFNYVRNELKSAGLNYKVVCFAGSSAADDTPLLYNADKLKLLDSGHHLYTYGNNGNSKGYTWGYFEDIATGTKFICLSTHLWWKSESEDPGSNESRRKQAAEIVALSDKLIAMYGCPMIMAGDLNTNTTSTAYKELLNGSFEDCHDIAAVKTNSRGHHKCSAEGYSTEMYSGNYTSNAIDHLLIKNKGDFRMLSFYQCILDFYWPLSDHMPAFIDFSFK